eukprot:6378302-Prymnesium_polylepis.1
MSPPSRATSCPLARLSLCAARPPLAQVALHSLLHGYGLLDKFRISKHRLLTFTRHIMDGYRAENPYHNATHALDVVLNTNYFLRHTVMSEIMQPIDRLAALVASVIHDYQHPGLNNVFLQASRAAPPYRTT